MMENIDFTLKFAAVGITIVFAALTIISGTVMLMRRADERWQAHEKAAAEAATEKEPTTDTLTLVLITAAAATMLKGRFHIKKIRRLSSKDAPRSAWSSQGRAILMGSHIVSKRR